MASRRQIYIIAIAADEPDRTALLCLRHRITAVVTEPRSAPLAAGASRRGIRVECAADAGEAATFVLASTAPATALIHAADPGGRSFAAAVRRILSMHPQSVIDLD